MNGQDDADFRAGYTSVLSHTNTLTLCGAADHAGLVNCYVTQATRFDL